MAVARPDGRDDSLADAGDDRFFGRPADQLGQVGAHGHAGAGLELNAVLCNPVEGRSRTAARVRTVDHLGADAGLDGFEHVSTGQVDGRRRFPVEVDLGAVGDDEGLDDPADIAL